MWPVWELVKHGSCTVRLPCGSRPGSLYTWRHDSVLSQVENFISQTIDADVEIYCDVRDRPWTIPPDIVATSDRADLVIVKQKAKTVIITAI